VARDLDTDRRDLETERRLAGTFFSISLGDFCTSLVGVLDLVDLLPGDLFCNEFRRCKLTE